MLTCSEKLARARTLDVEVRVLGILHSGRRVPPLPAGGAQMPRMTEQELNTIWSEHHPRVYKFALKKLDFDEALAEEAVQEAFCMLWKNGYDSNPGGALFNYVRAAMKTLIRRIQQQKREIAIEPGTGMDPTEPKRPLDDWENALVAKRLLRDVLVALSWPPDWISQLRAILQAGDLAAGLESQGLKSSTWSMRLNKVYRPVLDFIKERSALDVADRPLRDLHELLERCRPGWDGRQPHGLSKFLDRLLRTEPRSVVLEAFEEIAWGKEAVS
jgi:hypothetical protein